MSSVARRRSKSASCGLSVAARPQKAKSGMPRAKASGKVVAYRHPAAFGEAARKYAGIVRSGKGGLSTHEGFDD